ncbi:MAG TPA: phenylalanine--tRNA ligase beta subunit-related protein, partial [Leptospiraceae bacterium]|nr:phenylalanine--tRNA ligase beta subunit-related protein [Leptospiraceae bacterium]
GGFDSGVNNSTKTLIMESAVFRREDVRRSIRKTGIRSEAAVRYEKGQNPFTPIPVIRRAIELLKENGCTSLKAYEPDGFILDPDRKVKIETSFAFIRAKLGKDFSKELILEKLHKLGFITEEKNPDALIITIPEYRNQYDILIPEDIVEEVGRSIGYAEIDLLPLRMDVAPALLSESRTLERKLKTVLSERFCYSEVYNYSFAAEKDTQFEGKTETLKIQNSMPEEYSYLRTSVYPGLLKNLRANFDRFEKIRIFELGRTYFPEKGTLGREKKQFGLASVVNRKQDTFETKEEDFQNMKNEILHILRILNLQEIRMEKFSQACFHPNCSVRFFAGQTAVAEAGLLHPSFSEQFDFK